MATAPERLRVVIADDFEPYRRVLAELVKRMPEVDLVGQAASGPELVGLCRRLRPRVVVADAGMPALPALQLLDAVRTESPGSALVVVSAEADPFDVRRTLAAGATAWVLKADAYADLERAIRLAALGRVFVSARLGSAS